MNGDDTQTDDFAQFKHVKLFLGLNDEELRSIWNMTESVRYSKGAVILRQGDVGDRFLILKCGRVAVRPLLDDDEDLLVRFVDEQHDDNYVGEIALLDGKPRSANVIASVPTTCWSLDADKFRKVLESYSKVAMNVLDHLATRLRHTTERTCNLVNRRSADLVLIALRELAQDGIRDRLGRVTLEPPKQDVLADMSAITREAVNRALQDELFPSGATKRSGTKWIAEHRAESIVRYWRRCSDLRSELQVLEFLKDLNGEGRTRSEIVRSVPGRNIGSAIKRLLADGYIIKHPDDDDRNPRLARVDDAAHDQKDGKYRRLHQDQVLLLLETLAVDHAEGELFIGPTTDRGQGQQVIREARKQVIRAVAARILARKGDTPADDETVKRAGAAVEALKREGYLRMETVARWPLVITAKGRKHLDSIS